MARHSIQVSEADGVRYLHFGSAWVQGAMRMARPWALELEYTREMMAALVLRDAPDFPENALLVGLGAGSLAKFLYRHRPACRLTVLEINPEVAAIARSHFRLPDDPLRLRIEIADGAAWVKESRQKYDIILVDGFDRKARAGALESGEFYTDCRARLARRGLLVVNLLSNRKGFRESVRQLGQAFGARVLTFPPCECANVIAFAAAGAPIEISPAEFRASAEALRRDTGLNLRRTVARLERDRPARDLAL